MMKVYPLLESLKTFPTFLRVTLFAMALSPGTFLVGASGGDYALIFAFLANLIINWNSMTGDVSSKIRWVRLFFVVCWLLLDIGVLIHRLLTSKVSHDSWQAHMGGGIAGITLGKREIVWKIRVKLVYLGLLILWNPKPLNWEIKLKWTGLAIYIVVMISVILSIIFHPKPKSYRMYDPPCSLFRVCKQMDAAFQCSAMTTREQKWWKCEVTIFIDRIIWLVIKIKKYILLMK